MSHFKRYSPPYQDFGYTNMKSGVPLFEYFIINSLFFLLIVNWNILSKIKTNFSMAKVKICNKEWSFLSYDKSPFDVTPSESNHLHFLNCKFIPKKSFFSSCLPLLCFGTAFFVSIFFTLQPKEDKFRQHIFQPSFFPNPFIFMGFIHLELVISPFILMHIVTQAIGYITDLTKY